jgi:hypothetical protein
MPHAKCYEMEVTLALLIQRHEIIYFEVTHMKKNEPISLQKLCWMKNNGMVTE